MPTKFLHRIDEALANDARFAAAMRRLPAAAGTAGWPAAEQAARSASNAAVQRALWRAVRALGSPRSATALRPGNAPASTSASPPCERGDHRARTSGFPPIGPMAIGLCVAFGLAAAVGTALDALSAPRPGDTLEIPRGPYAAPRCVAALAPDAPGNAERHCFLDLAAMAKGGGSLQVVGQSPDSRLYGVRWSGAATHPMRSCSATEELLVGRGDLIRLWTAFTPGPDLSSDERGSAPSRNPGGC